MADIAIPENTARTSFSVTAGDIIQCKQGNVLIGTTATAGSGVVLGPRDGFTVVTSATLYYELLSARFPALLAQESF